MATTLKPLLVFSAGRAMAPARKGRMERKVENFISNEGGFELN